MNDAFDVVCIGTGMSALAYAVSRLTKRPGTRLLMLEKHRVAGGYATKFERPKQRARFEISLHKLSGMGPHGNLRGLLERFDLFDRIDWIYPDSLFDARYGRNRVVLRQDARAAEQTLTDCFPACAEGVATIFEEIRSHGYDGYMQFQTLSGDYEPDFKRLRFAHRHLKTLSVWDAVSARVACPMLREIICLPCVYVGAFPEQTSYLYFLHVMYASLFAGSAYPRGGAHTLTAAFMQRIEWLGGRIDTSSEVTKILVDAELRAYGVDTPVGTILPMKWW